MKTTLTILLLSISLSVFANEGVDEVKKQTVAEIDKAVSNIRFKCKCPVSFSVNWGGFTTVESARKAFYIVKNFNQAMPSFCADDGIAKACQIKSVIISYGQETSSRFSNGTADFVTNGITQHGFDSISSKLEGKETK